MPIARANGIFLYDSDGKRYIDAISSWYTTVYGHCHPQITGRVAEQMQRLDQVVFSGFTHEPAVVLAEELCKILPQGQEKVFFSDNGSTAVEVALKISLQYHFNRGKRRPVLLAFEEGFHGDTFGAMSVSGLSVYNGPFGDFSLEVKRIPVPRESHPAEILSQLDELLSQNDVAAFIYEPLVQGAAAMKTHHAEGLNTILRLLRERGVLLIADEVMTGFGKTGTHFASEQLQEQPDLICLSKALTAGLLPMGVTTCTKEVFEAFYSDETAKGFFHGHTYTANPLACTAALAGLELLRSEAIREGIRSISEAHKAFRQRIQSHPALKESRQCGVILALDLQTRADRYGDFRDRMYRFFMDRGIYLRPLGNTVYILPPYVIGEDDLEHLYKGLEAAMDFAT